MPTERNLVSDISRPRREHITGRLFVCTEFAFFLSTVGLCGALASNAAMGVFSLFDFGRLPPRPLPRFARLLRWVLDLGEVAPFSADFDERE